MEHTVVDNFLEKKHFEDIERKIIKIEHLMMIIKEYGENVLNLVQIAMVIINIFG